MRSLVFVAVFLASQSHADDTAIRAAIEASLPHMQRTGPSFWQGSGCISCHNNTLPDLAVFLARDTGITVNEQAFADARALIADFLGARRERLLEGLAPGGGQNTVSSILFSLALQEVPTDETLEAGARYLKMLQAEDGSWPILNHRPPLVSSTASITAMSIVALKSYAPAPRRGEYDDAIRRAVAWLAETPPRVNEDAIFRIVGLSAGGASREIIDDAVAALLAEQRPDGGWSQLRSLESDAYATGQALFALHSAGVDTAAAPFRKGVEFLLKTQLPDGSWHVITRSEPSQVYFEAGYPHGVDQFISAAGAAWATAALALTQRP